MKNKSKYLVDFIVKNHAFLSEKTRCELFSLRKNTFRDRLNWEVECIAGMESDEYDNANATYVLGTVSDKIICGARFIATKNPNMITGTFFKYFKEINIPDGNFVEASRFFVDKNRLKELGLSKYPVTFTIFLAIINYALEVNYEAIYAIVSYPMYLICRRSGWRVDIVANGHSGTEKIYLIRLPVDEENRDIICKKISYQ